MLQIHDRPSKNLKNLPKNWGIPMHWGQKPTSDLRDISAQCAETCTRFKTELCTVCIIFPQI